MNFSTLVSKRILFALLLSFGTHELAKAKVFQQIPSYTKPNRDSDSGRKLKSSSPVQSDKKDSKILQKSPYEIRENLQSQKTNSSQIGKAKNLRKKVFLSKALSLSGKKHLFSQQLIQGKINSGQSKQPVDNNSERQKRLYVVMKRLSKTSR